MEKWIIGIGGMKCATTWLYYCLNEHPDIYMSPIKEINYFNKKYDKGETWYLDNYKHCPPDRIRGEFSPTYLYYKICAERIYNFCPDAKIIVSIRNPITRLISTYKHSIRSGGISVDLSFAEAIKVKPGPLKWGLYYQHLMPFYEYFGKENIVVVVFEEIAQNPKKVVRDLYSQINVSPDFVPSVISKYVSKGIVPRFAFLEKFRRKLYMQLADYGHGDVIDILVRSRIPELYRRLNKKSEGKIEKKVLLTDELRSELISYYQEDVQNLKKLTGLPLRQWNEFNELAPLL
jgi:hypothetical protein